VSLQKKEEYNIAAAFYTCLFTLHGDIQIFYIVFRLNTNRV